MWCEKLKEHKCISFPSSKARLSVFTRHPFSSPSLFPLKCRTSSCSFPPALASGRGDLPNSLRSDLPFVLRCTLVREGSAIFDRVAQHLLPASLWLLTLFLKPTFLSELFYICSWKSAHRGKLELDDTASCFSPWKTFPSQATRLLPSLPKHSMQRQDVEWRSNCSYILIFIGCNFFGHQQSPADTSRQWTPLGLPPETLTYSFGILGLRV